MLLKSIYPRLLEFLVRAWNMEFTPNISYIGHVTQIYIYPRLLELLVRAWNMEFTPNISYMGHVTQICNKIEEVRKGSEDLMENTYNRYCDVFLIYLFIISF